MKSVKRLFKKVILKICFGDVFEVEFIFGEEEIVFEEFFEFF